MKSKFPQACDIASTNVISVHISQTISEAVEKMIINEHRDIVVENGDIYYVLHALEVINIYKNNIDLETPLSELNLIQIPTIHKETNILEIVQYLEEKTEYICVINDDKSLYGIMTHTDITSNIDPEILMDNFKIDDFLKLMRRSRWVHQNMKTADVLDDMFRHSFESVIVVEDLKPIGLLTTKDVVKLIKEKADLNLELKHYMMTPVETINKNTSIKETLDFIKCKHYKRVVITDDDGILAGVVTQKELISLTYNNWSMMMREHQEELKEINAMLKNKNKEYEILASTDPLTGLYNRYKFEQLYHSSIQLMRQRKAFVSLILLDIDHFKQVNDTFGHNIGDRVLRKLANTLLANVRNIDIVCRWGGEEFLILLPTVHQKGAVMIAEKLRNAIETTHFSVVDSITASFGVTQMTYDTPLEETVALADKALYLAKKSGRNCVKTL